MTRNEVFPISKKNLAYIFLILLAFVMIALGHRVDAASNTYSGGGRACDSSTHPTPYTNGAPMARVFYPADGSTVTITSTGAVIKQSPCATPYREGWVDPSNLCNLNSFDQLSGQIRSGNTNPYSNGSSNNYTNSCDSSSSNTNSPSVQPAPSIVNNVQNTNTSSSVSNASSTNAGYTSTCNINYSSCCNTSNTAYNNYPACCNNNQSSICDTYNTSRNNSNLPNNASNSSSNGNYTSPVTNSSYSNSVAASNNSVPTNYNNNNAYSGNGKATALPNTGPSDVLQLGGISTVLGTVGHFFYRRRATS